jgi:hypothetical protein
MTQSGQTLFEDLQLKSAGWKDVAELIGIGAIVVSLVFVVLQLKQSQDIVVAELRQARESSNVELNSLITSHPDIWVRGNSGEELSRNEKAVYRRLIEALHWSHWTTWRRNLQFGQDVPREIAIADFAGYLHQNPGALMVWIEYVDDRESTRKQLVSNYDENRFISAVNADLDRLDQVTN